MALTRYLLGKNVTITVIPQAVDNVGNLTPQTSYAFVGKADRAEVQVNPIKEDIHPLDALLSNNVVIVDNASIVLSEISRLLGSYLPELIMAWQYFFIRISGPAGGKKWEMYTSRGAFTQPQERGKSVISCTFDLADVGGVPIFYGNV